MPRLQAHQIEQVKGENTRLEAAVTKERFGHVRAQQECEKLQAQVTQLEEHGRAADAAVKDATAEAALLTAVVAEAEKVLQRTPAAMPGLILCSASKAGDQPCLCSPWRNAPLASIVGGKPR